MIALTVNGERKELAMDADTPLLWALRERLKLTGTKYGCGIAACGACTVHADGNPIRSCITPLSLVEGRSITTIEGLSADGSHPVQKAWVAEQVPQCGYCQPGFIMATAALLKVKPKPTDQEIDDALTNICRCGTYGALRRAVHRAAALLGGP